MTSESEKLIHVKFEYDEALNIKKDLLSSEANLLRITRAIKDYHLLRSEELKLKTRLHSKINEFLTEIKKMLQTVPRIKIPDILRGRGFEGHESDGIEAKIKIAKEKNYNQDIESQLQEIQEKLRRLQ